MATIDIKTPQNVVIQYEIASIGQRIFSFFIDAIALTLVSVVYFYFAEKIVKSTIVDDLDYEKSMEIIVAMIYILIVGFYSLYIEMFGNGQSLGKLAMGIKVIKTNGEELEFFDCFSRWSTRLIDVWLSSGILSIVLIATTRSGQRLGDVLAGTTVIKKHSSSGFRLADILKLNTRDKENFEFHYPLVRKLSEQDVVLIKNVINRFNENGNEASKKSLTNITNRVIQIIEQPIEIKGSVNQVLFLKKVISEYIVLTR